MSYMKTFHETVYGKYDVFTRTPWKRNDAWPGGWEPHGGAKKRYIERGVSFEEARSICAEGNRNNVPGKPGQLYYEFEEV